MRIIFCGTPAFAVPSLQRLLAEPGFEVTLVITQPDRPRGRHQHMSMPAAKEVAVASGVSVFQPAKIKTKEVEEKIAAEKPDAVVIIAYGRIITTPLLAIPRLGWINLHASLLPKYRGAAPIQWAVANGETQTGLTTMQIDEGLDTGPILEQFTIDIGLDETATDLSARMAEAGAPLLVSTLRGLGRGEISPNAQTHPDATFAPPLEKIDGQIDWQMSAALIYNRIRGFQPWPGAFTSFQGATCHIWGRPAESQSTSAPGTIEKFGDGWAVVCGDGRHLKLEFMQLEGRKRITAGEFANGARLKGGELFGVEVR